MRSERLTVRLPGELVSHVRRQAAEQGLPPATMARLLIERSILRGESSDISERLTSLENTVINHQSDLKKLADAVVKIAEGNR